MTTLCGQEIGADSYSGTDAVADCANCIRRSRDQSRISSAFFEQEEGAELLRLSLEQARQQRKERTPGAPSAAPAAARKPLLRVVPPPSEVPDEVGELRTHGFKASGQGVWRSPAGVIVRMSGPGHDRFMELVFDGSVVVTRDGAGVRVRAGDVEVRPAGGGVDVRLRH